MIYTQFFGIIFSYVWKNDYEYKKIIKLFKLLTFYNLLFIAVQSVTFGRSLPPKIVVLNKKYKNNFHHSKTK